MKARILTIILLNFIYFHLFAQSVKVEYKNIHNNNPKQQEFVATLLYDNQKSTYTHHKLAKGESPTTKIPSKEELIEQFQKTGQMSIHLEAYKDSIGQVIYVDFANNKIKVRQFYTDIRSKKGDPMIHEESLTKINWKIEDEQKKIANFLCQKATARFRGRNYTAWFAPDIPISAGPWKLHGLSGLILEAYDENKEIQFLLENIEYPVQINSIQILKDEAGKKISFEEYKYYQSLEGKQKLNDKYFTSNAALMSGRDATVTPAKIIHHNPIEKEFEE